MNHTDLWVELILMAVAITIALEALHVRRRARMWIMARIQKWMMRRMQKALERTLNVAMLIPGVRDPMHQRQPQRPITLDQIQQMQGLRNVANDPAYIGKQHKSLAQALGLLPPLDEHQQVWEMGSTELNPPRPPDPPDRNRIYNQGLPMSYREKPKLSDTDTFPPTGRERESIFAAPPEHSLNDYAKYREQDQQVSQLAAQLQAMGTAPWVIGEQKIEEQCVNAETSTITRLSLHLNGVSGIPAVAGEQRGMAVRGSVYFVEMARYKIRVSSSEESAELLATLNNEFFSYAQPFRTRALKALHDYALKPTSAPPSAEWTTFVACGQASIMCESKEKAQTIADDLNGMYLAAIAPYRATILEELAKVTAPDVKRTVDHKLDEHDPGYKQAKALAYDDDCNEHHD